MTSIYIQAGTEISTYSTLFFWKGDGFAGSRDQVNGRNYGENAHQQIHGFDIFKDCVPPDQKHPGSSDYKAVQVDIQIIPCIGPIVHVYGPVQCELDRCQSADLSHSVTVESHISQRYATAVSG